MVIPHYPTCLNRHLSEVLSFLFITLLLWPLPAAAQQPHQTRQAFIGLSASDNQVYVQQQLILTITLTYSDQVIRGELSAPEHPDALIEQLGRQREYRERINGDSYRVVERRYAIFPQSSGRLQLPPVEFEGLARHPRGHVVRLSDSARLFDIEVLDVPAEFSGDIWLPARGLAIADQGLTAQRQVRPADNLTRTVTVTAEGLPATVLPPVEHRYPSALRNYPEPASRNSSTTADGVTGILEQTVALVPVPGHSGDVRIPEVRIPWWDVEADRERMAVLPARQLTLAGSGPGQSPEVTGPDPAEESQVLSSEPDPDAVDSAHWPWLLALGLLATGWAATALGWWWQVYRRSGRGEPPAGSSGAETSEKWMFHLIQTRAADLDPAFFGDFPRWVGILTGQPCSTTREALAQLHDADLTTQVSDWQRSLFHYDGPVPPESRELVKSLKAVRKDWYRKTAERGRPGTRSSTLPRFYPDGIGPEGSG